MLVFLKMSPKKCRKRLRKESSNCTSGHNTNSDNSFSETEFMSLDEGGKLNVIFKMLMNMKTDISDLNDALAEIESLKSLVKQVQEENSSLKNELLSLKQVQCKNALVFNGLAAVENVHDTELIKKVGNLLNVPLTDLDIQDCYRYKVSQRPSNTVVVKLWSKTRRDEMLKSR